MLQVDDLCLHLDSDNFSHILLLQYINKIPLSAHCYEIHLNACFQTPLVLKYNYCGDPQTNEAQDTAFDIL